MTVDGVSSDEVGEALGMCQGQDRIQVGREQFDEMQRQGLLREGLPVPPDHLMAPLYRSECRADHEPLDLYGLSDEEYRELSPKLQSGAGELYQAYCRWCREAGNKQVKKARFGRSLSGEGYGKKKVSGLPRYTVSPPSDLKTPPWAAKVLPREG